MLCVYLCACVVQITIKGVIFVCAGRFVCVFLSVKFVFIPNIIEVHPSIVSYRRGRGGWLMIYGDFYNKHCFKIHTEVAMTPYCFSSTVCLSFRPTLSLFIYVDVYVCVCFVDITVGFFHYFNIAIFAMAVEFVVFRFLAFVFVLFVVFFGLSVLLFRCLRSNSQRTYVTYHWKD